MRILVTGAAGFVGLHVTEQGAKRGLEVVAATRADADLRDAGATASLIAREAPDAIIHLASPRGWREGNGVEAAREELEMARSLLSAVRELEGAPPIVWAGSAGEYGDQGADAIPEGAELRPRSAYAATKAALSLAVTNAAGYPVVWARCFNLLGPGQPDSAPVANWVKQVREATDGDEIRVGSLDLERDFLDVRDAANSFLDLASLHVEEPLVVNVCSGVGIRLDGLCAEVIGLSGKRLNAVEDPELVAADSPRAAVGDPSKLEELTGPRTLIPLEESLRGLLARPPLHD